MDELYEHQLEDQERRDRKGRKDPKFKASVYQLPQESHGEGGGVRPNCPPDPPPMLPLPCNTLIHLDISYCSRNTPPPTHVTIHERKAYYGNTAIQQLSSGSQTQTIIV
jgi:hypothetical protein